MDDMRLPPRDFIGYGAKRPDFLWPNGARIAVNFGINYEEGGEDCVLDGDAASETRISDVVVDARPGGRDLNVESSYEYGSRVGYWRMLRAFTERDLPATVNIVGRAAEKNPDAIAAMVAAGMDLHLHGWRWCDYAALSEAEERAALNAAIDQATTIAGVRPLGAYMGMPSLASRRLAAEAGMFYCSDCYNDDLPWWAPDHPQLLMMPYSLDTNDSRFGRAGGGYVLGAEFETYICDSLDALETLGETAMITIGLHARLIGRPGRIGALWRILDDAAARKGVWIAHRGDIAKAFAAAVPNL